MEAVAATAAPAEAALDADAKAGDVTVFRELYAPHLEGVHDFALRAVRDSALAEDVLRRTFARAWDAFPERGSDVRDWLYSVAQEYAREGMRYRERRNGAVREALDFTQLDPHRVPDASRALFDRELVELVWDAAAGLSFEEYTLLALDVRHGIVLENAAALRAARLRSALDERVTCELLMRRSRRLCAGLDAVVNAAGDEHSIRRLVDQHVRDCEACRVRKRNFVRPSDVLGSLAPMRPAPELAADVWRRLEAEVRGRRRRRFGIL